MDTTLAFGWDVAWKSSLLLACAGLATLALRRSSASARHLAWALATAGALALPPLALAVPAWSWAVLASREGPSPAPRDVPSPASLVPPRAVPPPVVDPAPDRGPGRPAPPPADARTDEARGGLASGVRKSDFALRPAACLLAAWWLVTAVVLAPPFFGRLSLRRLARGASP